ncbi:MAG: hypothetical protein ACJAS1_007324 [Oleiphilaceae bacterium]|jgi:hypothetical protein
MSVSDLEGMTVNERLYTLNLMGDFDSSIKSRQREVAIQLLEKAKFSNSQAVETVDAIFNDLKKYGY